MGIKSQKLVKNIDFGVQDLFPYAFYGQSAVLAAESVVLVIFTIAVRAVQAVFSGGAVDMVAGKLFDNRCPPS
ncbi:MAG: hypothetical protein R6V41_09950 [Desulfobacteraceae bacterium]